MQRSENPLSSAGGSCTFARVRTELDIARSLQTQWGFVQACSTLPDSRKHYYRPQGADNWPSVQAAAMQSPPWDEGSHSTPSGDASARYGVIRLGVAVENKNLQSGSLADKVDSGPRMPSPLHTLEAPFPHEGGWGTLWRCRGVKSVKNFLSLHSEPTILLEDEYSHYRTKYHFLLKNHPYN